MTRKYAEPTSNVSPEARAAFKDWLKRTLKPGDALEGIQRCDGEGQPPKVFDHWADGHPRRADGSRIATSRVFFINGQFLRNTPHLSVTENPRREGILLGEADLAAFAARDEAAA